MSAEAQSRADLIRGLQRHLARRQSMGIRRVSAGKARVTGEPAIQSPVEAQTTNSGAVPSAPASPTYKGPTNTGSGIPAPRVAQKAAPAIAPCPSNPVAPNAVAMTPGARSPAESGAPPSARAPVDLAAQCLNMNQLRAAVEGCRACELCETRTQTVFADGSAEPGGIFFIGEAPGADDERTGVPFVGGAAGAAGQLLTDIIVKGMGLRRDQVTIANIIKCRPPGDRDPKSSERAQCTPYLERQIEWVNPAVIIPLGTHAAQHLLQSDLTLANLRGTVHSWQGRKVVPTFHPEYLLRNPANKRACWQDIQLAMVEAGITSPGSK